MEGMLFLLISALVVSGGECSGRSEQRGPSIRAEPPFRVEFSNSSSTELRCAADGHPAPRLSWQTGVAGGSVPDVPGLRHTHPDGTLVFQPFSRQEYREAVHSAVYRCVATNAVGSVMTRDVHLRGVVNQRFSPQVKVDDYAYLGNTAVLKCEVPVFVREFVSVDSWIRNDDLVLMTDTRVRSYTVLYTGELLIHEAQKKDAEWSYRCQTRHRLTGEMAVSPGAGKITVREKYTSTLPEVSFHHPEVRAKEGQLVQLPCVARGNPPPSYKS